MNITSKEVDMSKIKVVYDSDTGDETIYYEGKYLESVLGDSAFYIFSAVEFISLNFALSGWKAMPDSLTEVVEEVKRQKSLKELKEAYQREVREAQARLQEFIDKEGLR